MLHKQQITEMRQHREIMRRQAQIMPKANHSRKMLLMMISRSARHRLRAAP
jgi:hypothetical protein